MTIEKIFQDKALKAKAKVAQIADWLINNELPLYELLVFADKQTGTHKTTCIEAIEYATQKSPDIGDKNLLDYVTKALKEDEPRIKWESAKVIGNIAKCFPNDLAKPIANLLSNVNNPGTVVRWATAYALAEIVMMKTSQNKRLFPKLKN